MTVLQFRRVGALRRALHAVLAFARLHHEDRRREIAETWVATDASVRSARYDPKQFRRPR
ncbi:hypothetical protein ACVCIC_25170 [Burkholderia glumae]|uniref:hypothetical protein n=1 Tax=Burkholderia glumae TaxID=337 RepID=UPI00214F8177|nr:hypothetical protein [Burkholderia glumae]